MLAGSHAFILFRQSELMPLYLWQSLPLFVWFRSLVVLTKCPVHTGNCWYFLCISWPSYLINYHCFALRPIGQTGSCLRIGQLWSLRWKHRTSSLCVRLPNANFTMPDVLLASVIVWPGLNVLQSFSLWQKNTRTLYSVTLGNRAIFRHQKPLMIPH